MTLIIRCPATGESAEFTVRDHFSSCTNQILFFCRMDGQQVYGRICRNMQNLGSIPFASTCPFSFEQKHFLFDTRHSFHQNLSYCTSSNLVTSTFVRCKSTCSYHLCNQIVQLLSICMEKYNGDNFLPTRQPYQPFFALPALLQPCDTSHILLAPQRPFITHRKYHRRPSRPPAHRQFYALRVSPNYRFSTSDTGQYLCHSFQLSKHITLIYFRFI